MKTGVFSLATLSLLPFVLSQPHARHQHHHHEQKRDVRVVNEYKTVTAPAKIIVYIDENRKPFSTQTIHGDETPTKAPEPVVKIPSPAPKPVEPKPAPPKPAAPAYKPEAAAPVYKPKPAPSKPAPESPPAHAPTPKAPSPPHEHFESNPSPAPSGPGFSSGITYSPYNADHTCKTAGQVAQDLQAINGFSVIRLYGTDCDQVANVLAAIKGKGISLFLGIFDITQISSEAKIIADAVHGDWHLINSISVGNELVNFGKASVEQVIAAISQARDALKAAGYQGPVVTVDTMVTMKANPELCHASDFCAINCHAFFDGNVLPDGAGDFVQNWVNLVSTAAGGKTVVITESGWPTQGDTNNKAVPSKENQAAAIASIQKVLGKNVIQFNLYNDLYKESVPATFHAEQYWGIKGNAPSA